MRNTVTVTQGVRAPADAIWHTISGIDGVHTWLPIVSACQVIGDGEGAQRICTTAQGQLVERIERIDHLNKRFQYAIHEQALLPITNVQATMQVQEHGSHHAEVTWSLSFDVDDHDAQHVEATIKELYAQGIQGLAVVHQAR